MKKLKNIRQYLLDMDGTIYLDNELFDGTTEFLDFVKKSGGRCIFMTNNSSKSVEKYIEKLASMGIKADRDDFLTSLDATAEYLKKQSYKKIYAFGTRSFEKELREKGFNITTEPEDDVDCLCMGYDTELNYKKLEDACILLRGDISYIATNPDWVCPTWYGFAPDCGSVAEMLFRATGKRPLFIGKPEPYMANLAVKKTGIGKDATAVVGDRIYTDIACGVNAGITSVFVLSGEGKMSDIEKYNVHPDYVFNNIRELLNALEEEEK